MYQLRVKVVNVVLLPTYWSGQAQLSRGLLYSIFKLGQYYTSKEATLLVFLRESWYMYSANTFFLCSNMHFIKTLVTLLQFSNQTQYYESLIIIFHSFHLISYFWLYSMKTQVGINTSFGFWSNALSSYVLVKNSLPVNIKAIGYISTVRAQVIKY